MEMLICEIDIRASVSTIWNTLIKSDCYKIWSRAFSSNSYFDGEWNQGSEINHRWVGRKRYWQQWRPDEFKQYYISSQEIAVVQVFCGTVYLHSCLAF